MATDPKLNPSHTVPAPDLFTMRLDGPAPEVEVSRDMIKRGLLVGPLLVGLCAVIWGSAGAWSSAYGLAIVLVAIFVPLSISCLRSGRDVSGCADTCRHPPVPARR